MNQKEKQKGQDSRFCETKLNFILYEYLKVHYMDKTHPFYRKFISSLIFTLSRLKTYVITISKKHHFLTGHKRKL